MTHLLGMRVQDFVRQVRSILRREIGISKNESVTCDSMQFAVVFVFRLPLTLSFDLYVSMSENNSNGRKLIMPFICLTDKGTKNKIEISTETGDEGEREILQMIKEVNDHNQKIALEKLCDWLTEMTIGRFCDDCCENGLPPSMKATIHKIGFALRNIEQSPAINNLDEKDGWVVC